MMTVKKLILVALALVLAIVVLSGCNARSYNEQTKEVNGYFRTVKTLTENGRTTQEIIYTDPNGNILDAEYGEAVFEAMQAGRPIPMPASRSALCGYSAPSVV